MDNGFASCADAAKLQEVGDHFGPEHIHAFFRRWTEALPQPFTAEDREAGYAHRLSVLQAEFSLTQVFAQPRYGRAFFEQAIRDHLDLGRPDQVSLLFDRRVTKRTPGIFRTRVITDGVNPNIQATFKHSAVKQYFKEGRALRTETTINDTYDIGVGRSLENLPKLIEFGRALNRRLLAAEEASAQCLRDIARVDQVLTPNIVEGQRVPALRFGDPRAFALEAALCRFAVGPLAPLGFRAADIRSVLPDLRGGAAYSASQATYDLRRLRLKGLIERVPKSHRLAQGPRLAAVDCLWSIPTISWRRNPSVTVTEGDLGFALPCGVPCCSAGRPTTFHRRSKCRKRDTGRAKDDAGAEDVQIP